MKDHLKDVFFQLLRMGLWGKGELALERPLSDEDWSVLYRYAQNHTLEGILFDAFPLMPEEQLPPRTLRMKWTVRVDQIERNNTQMNEIIADQYAHFVQQGVKPILLKGQGVATCYRHPTHRVSGDIDWHFEENGYNRALQLVREKGVKVNAVMTFCCDYGWKGIPIEHQRKIFDVRSPFKIAYLKKLENKYKTKQQSLLIEGQSVSLLAPELQVLQVNVHILKHLLGVGIGLRQICDAAILYHAYRDQIDSEKLRRMYKKIGVLKWMHLLHYILVNYLGLPKADLPFSYPDKLRADWMMDEIWLSGNFGVHDERYVGGKASFVSVHPDGARRMWQNMWRYLPYAPQEAVFFPIRRITARLDAFLSSRRSRI